MFKAVLRQVQVEIGQKVDQLASQSEDGWQQLVLGCQAYITGAMAEENRRILLIDGPSVVAHMISGALNELALSISHDQQPKEVRPLIECLLRGFRASHG